MITLGTKVISWSITALGLGVLGNVIAALIPVWTLLQMPPDSKGHLIVETYFVLVVSATTLIVVVPLAIIGLFKERQRMVAIVALCLSLSPIFFSYWVMCSVADLRHIFLES